MSAEVALAPVKRLLKGQGWDQVDNRARDKNLLRREGLSNVGMRNVGHAGQSDCTGKRC